MEAEGAGDLVRGVLLVDFEVGAADAFAFVGEEFAGFVFLPG